jgi:hypothetical protein
MIKIDRERYLKHTIIDLESLNETSSIDFPVLRNYSFDSSFGNFSPLSSDVPLTQNFKMNFQENVPTSAEETLFCQEPLVETTEQIDVEEEVSRKGEVLPMILVIMIMY